MEIPAPLVNPITVTLALLDVAGSTFAPPVVLIVHEANVTVCAQVDDTDAQRMAIILSNFTRFILTIFWLVKIVCWVNFDVQLNRFQMHFYILFWEVFLSAFLSCDCKRPIHFFYDANVLAIKTMDNSLLVMY
jgi:hypothetical protein